MTFSSQNFVLFLVSPFRATRQSICNLLDLITFNRIMAQLRVEKRRMVSRYTRQQPGADSRKGASPTSLLLEKLTTIRCKIFRFK